MQLQAHVRSDEAAVTMSMSDFGIEDCGTTRRMRGGRRTASGDSDRGFLDETRAEGSEIGSDYFKQSTASSWNPSSWALNSRHRHFLATSAPELPAAIALQNSRQGRGTECRKSKYNGQESLLGNPLVHISYHADFRRLESIDTASQAMKHSLHFDMNVLEVNLEQQTIVEVMYLLQILPQYCLLPEQER